MKTALEASELALPENSPVRVSQACDQALDKAVLKAISTWKRRVDIALWSQDCKDDDDTVQAYLYQQWYKDIEVSHDYPWYCESYAGKTLIKFTF